MFQPKISVILTTRDGATTLPKTLASLGRALANSPESEVLLVDNGSRDETPEFLNRFRDEHGATVIFEEKPGKSFGLNAAIDIAQGDLLAFVDDDVDLAPDWLNAFASAARKHPEAVVFIGQIRPDWAVNPSKWQVFLTDKGRSYGCTPLDMPEGPARPTLLKGGNFALRRLALGDQRFDTEECNYDGSAASVGGEDTSLAIKLGNSEGACIYVPKAVGKHWVPKGEMSINRIAARYWRIGRAIGNRPDAVRPKFKELLSCSFKIVLKLLTGRWGKAAYSVTTLAMKLGQRHQFRAKQFRD